MNISRVAFIPRYFSLPGKILLIVSASISVPLSSSWVGLGLANARPCKGFLSVAGGVS
ncbi:unknown protein [Microcystis aeruginosa NIES-843]|uniref:Uncharacterized protein n=1 Tax=Microcystis aeruginosa (strain NIES-843 / IAM M-2473) TaxID=449447 RepID=B0JGQ8_MICAN|nr:unknown protein [Microcystis aeruginosa NIES-843]